MTIVPPYIESLRPYVPGKPIEETERELGISGVAKLASNENPLGPSPKALEAAAEALKKVHLYPDGAAFYLKRRLAEFHGVDPAEVVVGNGSNEVIELLIRTFLRPEGHPDRADEALVADGSFIMYELSLQAHGVRSRRVAMQDRTFDLDAMADAVTDETRMIFVANPNNPTGTYVGKAAFERFLAKVPERVIVVMDEAYFEYVHESDYPDSMDYRAEHPNLVVLRTFSKIYGLAGLRVGYGIMRAELAGYINRIREPFNVNLVAQAAAMAALDDTAHVEKSRALNDEGLALLTEALPRLGVKVTPSVCNFVLADFERPGTEVFEALLRQGVIVRPMAGYGFTKSARISIGTRAENERLLAALETVLAR